MNASPADMPLKRFAREQVQAFARADSRDELMAEMRAQATAYFGGPVLLKEASAQPAPKNDPAVYQGTSKWQPAPVAVAEELSR